MHDLRTTCADRETKADHLGILKELSSSKTRNFERDRSFSFDLFFLWIRNKTKKKVLYICKTKGEKCSVLHYMDIPRDRLYKRTCLVTRRGVFSISFLGVLVKYSKNATVSIH